MFNVEISGHLPLLFRRIPREELSPASSLLNEYVIQYLLGRHSILMRGLFNTNFSPYENYRMDNEECVMEYSCVAGYV